jgi:signal peptidase II
MTKSQKTFLISIASILFVVILDRISKLFFINLFSLGESMPVLRNIFHFTLVYNTGIAFGLFQDQGIVFIIISIAAILLFSWFVYSQRAQEEFSQLSVFAFSLIIGGAFGNLIDRLQFGFVIDFIDFRIWPVFNIADSAITIGALILILKCIPFSAK